MLKKLAHRLIATTIVLIFVFSLVGVVPQDVFANNTSDTSNNLNQDGSLSAFQRTHAQLVQDSRASSGLNQVEMREPVDVKGEWLAACNEGRAADAGVPNGFCNRVANTNGSTSANPNPNLPIGTSELTQDLTGEAFDLVWYTATFGGGFTPPDTMGAVGPTQFFVTQNGAYRVFDKTTGAPDTSLDTLASAFWPASVDPNNNGGGDPRVRFDRLTDTWWVIAFTRENFDNRVIYAQSDGPILSLATVWTYWYITPKDTIGGGADAFDFADYPTLGVDSNAVMVGGNMFGASVTTSAWVIPKGNFPGGGGDASSVAHAFVNLNACVGGACIWTPMPVDSYDASANSYYVGQMAAGDDIMQLGTVTYPGGVPSISWQSITVNDKNDGWTSNSTPAGFGVPYPGVPAPTGVGSNWGLDTLSWRAIGGAHLRDGSIWFTNTSSVQGPQGDLLLFPLHGDRMSVVVYEFSTAGAVLTDTNIYDAVTPEGGAPTQAWMGAAVPNGQGHVVAGFTVTNLDGMAPSTAWSGRLVTDSNGYFSQPEIYIDGFNTGNARQSFESSPRETRWGDYSMTTVDPCDDMTFFTIQEYVDSGNSNWGGNWSTGFARIRSLPPTVEGIGTNPVPTGSASTVVNITGEDFYDTPATASASCRTRLDYNIVVNPGGVAVNSISYNSPTDVDLDLDTSAASCGELRIDIINPDGQKDQAVINIGTAAQCGVSAPTNDDVANAFVVSAGTNFNQDINGSTNEGTDPVLTCGDASYTNSVWYTYTAADDKVFATEITAGSFDSLVALLSGTPGDFNVLSCDVGSVAAGSLKSGETYYIMVANNSATALTEPSSVELNNFTFIQNDALTLFNSGTEGTSLIDTLLDEPDNSSYTTFTQTPPINTNSRYVMGDWNADGVRTPGVFDNGVFQYTNDLGPSSNWSAGMWVGNPPSLQGIVTGRFEAGFANDCIGWVDGNTSPVTGDLRFSLKRWCDMSATGAVALSAQFMGGVLGDSNGFVGTFSFVAGDWDGDSIDEMAVRRSDRITYTFIDPPSGAATFPQAQRWDTATATGPGGHTEDEGVFVGGDWDGNGTDSFGVVYSDAEFYYRNALSWNPGPWEFIFQGFVDPVTFDQATSTKTATGGNGPEFPFGPEGVPGNIAGATGVGGGIIDTSQNVEADLSVSKAGNFQVGEVGLVGDTITWTITVTNTGTAPANGVQITDNVPSELRVDDALADLGTVTVQGQQVTFNVESLGVGQTAQFQVVTTILGQPSSGLFNNSVNVLLPEGDGSGSDANLIASTSVSSVDGLPATGYAPKFRW